MILAVAFALFFSLVAVWLTRDTHVEHTVHIVQKKRQPYVLPPAGSANTVEREGSIFPAQDK
jgi:hypothetical protein